MSLFCGKCRYQETHQQTHLLYVTSGREDEDRSYILANRVSSCCDNMNIFTYKHKHCENVQTQFLWQYQHYVQNESVRIKLVLLLRGSPYLSEGIFFHWNLSIILILIECYISESGSASP
jgi:hypothetical protein